VLCSLQGNLLDANDHFVEFLSFPKVELMKMNMKDLMTDVVINDVRVNVFQAMSDRIINLQAMKNTSPFLVELHCPVKINSHKPCPVLWRCIYISSESPGEKAFIMLQVFPYIDPCKQVGAYRTVRVADCPIVNGTNSFNEYIMSEHCWL
jgi:hypothetical protein